jgi:hypothetical protein
VIVTGAANPLEVLVALGLLGLGAGAGAALTWYALTRRGRGRHENGPLGRP